MNAFSEAKFIRFEDKVFFVDLTTFSKPGGKSVFLIIFPDGSGRPAKGSDGPMMDILFSGRSFDTAKEAFDAS